MDMIRVRIRQMKSQADVDFCAFPVLWQAGLTTQRPSPKTFAPILIPQLISGQFSESGRGRVEHTPGRLPSPS
jgi:hypothetical protein